MSFEISKADKYILSAINARAIRQDLIASNIANADTPYYRPKDISFEEELTKKAQEEFGTDKNKELKLAKTSSKHLSPDDDMDLKPTIFFRDGHLAGNDGNSVDIDVEMSEMSKNNIMYNALIEAYKKDSTIFKTIIDSSKNI